MRRAQFLYDWNQYKGVYRQLCQWLGEQAKLDYPQASKLRCRFYNYASPSPQQVKTATQPEGRFQSSTVVSLL